jgi:hypothetical protein
MQNATARPRFRQDLLAEIVEEGGQRFIDVADPDSGHVFRFFEAEYSLACGMNGERDVAGLVKWAQDELGFSPSANEVQAVIAQLATLSFVGKDRGVDAVATKAVAAQQAAAPKADELAKGIVVGKQANANANAEVELGRAGANVASRDEKLPAADFALGASGAGAARQQPKAPVEDIALGAPGVAEPPRKTPTPPSDMSLDLADQFALKPGDVKEAVRQSKVMTAVEVPKDLLEAEAKPAKPIEKKPEPKPEPVKPEPVKPEPVKAKEPEKKPEPKPEPVKPEPVKAKEPESRSKPQAEKKPVELSKPPVVEKQPVAPPAPKQGVSPILISILILVVIGAGAFFVWKFVINKEETAQNTPPPKKVDPPPPPPPAEASSKVVMETPPAFEVKAGNAGAIETIEAADKDVKAGDVIATLVGAKAAQTEIDKLGADIAKLQPAVDTATTALETETGKENNEAGVKAAQAKLDRAKKPLNDKQTAQKTKQADLEKLVVKSPGDGKLALAGEAPLAVGAKVTADQVIGEHEDRRRRNAEHQGRRQDGRVHGERCADRDRESDVPGGRRSRRRRGREVHAPEVSYALSRPSAASATVMRENTVIELATVHASKSAASSKPASRRRANVASEIDHDDSVTTCASSRSASSSGLIVRSSGGEMLASPSQCATQRAITVRWRRLSGASRSYM